MKMFIPVITCIIALSYKTKENVTEILKVFPVLKNKS